MQLHHAHHQQDSHNHHQDGDQEHLPPRHAVEGPERQGVDLIRIILIEFWSRPIS